MTTKLKKAKEEAENLLEEAGYHRARAAAIRERISYGEASEAEAALRDGWAEEALLEREIFLDAVRLYESSEEETI